MDAITVFSEGLPAIFYFLLFVFVPGFVFSLVIFPRKNSLSALDRLVYSTVLGASSGIALVMIMYSVLGFDITPGNFILATVVFSAVLLMVWVCERWYLNTRSGKRREPGIPVNRQPPRPYYSPDSTTPQEQDTWTVVPRNTPARPEKSTLPPVILPGWRGKDQEAEARDIRGINLDQPEDRNSGKPAAITRETEEAGRVEPEKVPRSPAIQHTGLPRYLRKHLAKQTAGGPKETRQKVQTRVLVKESHKQEENRIVVASIRKMQKDIQRDLDKIILSQDSLTGTEKNIENIRIPKMSDVNKKLAEVKDELKDLDWLYE